MEKTYVITFINRSTGKATLQSVIKTVSKKGEAIEFLGTQDRREKDVDASDFVGKNYKVADSFK